MAALVARLLSDHSLSALVKADLMEQALNSRPEVESPRTNSFTE
jgi:hypothetical protein